MSDEKPFALTAVWNPEAKEGSFESETGTLCMTYGGAASLGGKDGVTNPEELLLASLSACFLQTWAIFIGKLKLPIEKPLVDATCIVDKDPAGGFHVTRVNLAPHVPAALLAERQADVEKSLQLAEKYCIISKVLKGQATLSVAGKAV